MRIAIIGSGDIGGTLGTHWDKAGHEVMFTSRHPEKLDHIKRQTSDGASIISIKEAFEASVDVYLLATPFKALPELAELYAGEYANTVVLDATNPYPERDGEMAQEIRDGNQNSSEFVAKIFSTAITAKAFNTIHAQHLKERAFQDGAYAVPYAAQDNHSKQITEQLIRDIGFEPVFVGDLAATDSMEVDHKVYGKSVDGKKLRQLLELK